MSSQPASLGVYQPVIRRKPKRFKKDGTPYKPRKGWGPYRSVPNERAVKFHLQLDVQALQQEIHNMTALRDILQTKVLHQRHSDEGSLLRLVREYHRVFRTGAALGEPEGQYQDQHNFMFSIVDPQVDVGNDLCGSEYMMYQMHMYSTLIRWISLTMRSYEVVQAEDSVVIQANSTLRFQVLPATIKSIFPHVMDYEWIVSQLVGKVVEPNITMTFYFNAEGKCCKLDADTDFVGAFASIIKDPITMGMLFSHALIADNSQLGMLEEPAQREPEEEQLLTPTSVAIAGTKSDLLRGDLNHTQREIERTGLGSSFDSAPMGSLQDIQMWCLQTVEAYYLAFEKGYPVENTVQSDFLSHRFFPNTTSENDTTLKYLKTRWKSLCECFDVLGFHQKAVNSIVFHRDVDMCTVSSSAYYSLCITPTTIASIFPHLLASPQICSAFVGEVLTVPAQLFFVIELDTGRIGEVEEQMDFETAISKIAANNHELQFVMSKAKLVPDGVSCRIRGV